MLDVDSQFDRRFPIRKYDIKYSHNSCEIVKAFCHSERLPGVVQVLYVVYLYTPEYQSGTSASKYMCVSFWPTSIERK